MFSNIDLFAKQLREDCGAPGIAVSIVEDDAFIFAKGYGVRKLDESQSVDEETLFGIASISKSFTAMALGMLVDEGQLSWNDRVIKHLPSFQLYDAYANREMTVMDLLVHRSGLPTVSGGTVWYGSDYSRHEVIDRIRHLKPASSFRSEYAYQNITYLVAGEIIRSLTGQSWDDFVAQRIFSPLEMHRSNTSIRKLHDVDNVAQPHAIVEGKLQVVPHRNYDNVGPAASINTSVKELAAYARLLLKGGEFQDQRLYSTDIAKDLWTPRTLIPIQEVYPVELKGYIPQFHNAYGLGWVIQDYFGEKKVSHSGGIDGLRSLLTMIPGQNLGIMVFANNEGPTALIMTNIILDILRGANPEKWYGAALELWAAEQEKRSKTIARSVVADTAPSLNLEKYSGKYFSAPVGEVVVSYEKRRLILRFPRTVSFTADLDHWHYDTFRMTWHDPVIPEGLVTFVLNAQGQGAELKLDQASLLDVDFGELHPIKRTGT